MHSQVPFEAKSFGELAMKIQKKNPRKIQTCYSKELRSLVTAMLQVRRVIHKLGISRQVYGQGE